MQGKHPMANSPELPGAYTPEDLETMHRVINRVADTVVLTEADREEMAAAALSFYQRGVTAEDQLFDLLVESAIGSKSPLRSAAG